MADLFISYRRSDAAYALLLYDRLSASFGRERVFRDFEAIQPGDHFDTTIETELDAAKAVVAIIGPEWVRAQARLAEPTDWVRQELARALRQKRPLFPLLVGGTFMPNADALPEEVRELTRPNAVTAADATFHRDVDRLVEALARIVPPRPAAPLAAAPDPRERRAMHLLRDQVSRIQIRAVELVQEGEARRAIDELTAGQELVMALLELSPDEVTLDLQLGYLYKTVGQAFEAAGDDASAARYVDLAASSFGRVKDRAGREHPDRAALAGAINGLGNVYAARGDLARAIEMYRSALQLVPDYAYAWHDLFAALDLQARAGDVALPAMREALANVKRFGAGQPGLGEGHLADLDAVFDHWSRAAVVARPTRRPPATRGAGPRQRRRT